MSRSRATRWLGLGLAVALSAGIQAGQTPAATWLDQAPEPGAASSSVLPRAGSRTAAAERTCLAGGALPAEAEHIRAAGWRPFQLFDRPLARAEVVVLGGLRDLTSDCAPASFQAFVFVGGAFVGTLSPVEMSTGRDGVVGMIRLLPGDVLTAEFARYRPGDSECCPSGRVRVSYQIDRTAAPFRLRPTARTVLRE